MKEHHREGGAGTRPVLDVMSGSRRNEDALTGAEIVRSHGGGLRTARPVAARVQRFERDLAFGIPNGRNPHPFVAFGHEQEVALVVDMGAGHRSVTRNEEVTLFGDDVGAIDAEQYAAVFDQLLDHRCHLGIGLDVVEVERAVLMLESEYGCFGIAGEETAFVVDSGYHCILVATDLDPISR